MFKKLFAGGLLTVFLLLHTGIAFAVGSVTQTPLQVDEHTRMITFAVTADATAATVPNTSLTAANLAFVKGWYLYNVRTYPGATAPTDATDMTLVDSQSRDVLGGSGTDLIDSTTCESTSAALPFYEKVTETLTLTVSNNAVYSAVFTIEVIFVK